MKATQRGIQSIEVAGQILQVVVEQARPLALKEIAELVDTPVAQVFTYLVSLTRVGMLKRHPITLQYEPGPLSVRLGVAALHSAPKVREAIPIADELGRRLGLNVFLTAWSRHGPTVVFYIEHGVVLDIEFRLGNVFTLTQTATGRLFSAYLPSTLCEEVIRNQTFMRDSVDIFRSDAFQSDLEAIRTEGLSIALGHPAPLVSAIAAPIFDAHGEVQLAISLFGSSDSFDRERINQVKAELRTAAAAVSDQVVGRP